MVLTKKKIVIILRWLIAAIFIAAGISKIIDPAAFAEDIYNYRLLPYLLVTICAIIFPWLEVFAGLFILTPRLRGGANFILLLLSFSFLLAISSALLRNLDITCGCFGVSAEGARISSLRLAEDIVLFIMILFVYINTRVDDRA